MNGLGHYYENRSKSRQLREKITTAKFEIGDFSFVDCGVVDALV